MGKSIFKNAIAKFILSFFNIAIPIIIGPYALRTLGANVMGDINYAQTIYSYFFIFASFGVYQYGIREASKVRDDKEKLSILFTNIYIITVIATALTTIIYIFSIKYISSNNIIFYSNFILIFNLFSNVFYIEWLNEALENYTFITKKTIFTKVIYVIMLVLLVKNPNDYIIYMILLTLSTFLNNFITFIYIKKTIKFNFKKIHIRKYIKPMIFVVILSNSNILYTQFDKLMLGSVVNTTVVAYYTAAQTICNMVHTLLMTIVYVSIPRLNNIVANDGDEKYLCTLKQIIRIYYLFLFPISIGLFILSREIMIIYGGKEFIQAIPLMQFFSLYLMSLGIESILSNQVMYIKGKEHIQVLVVGVFGIVNVLLNILLFKLNIFNGTTAIITTTISNLGIIIFQYIYIKKYMNINLEMFSFNNIKYLIISLIFIPISLFIKTFSIYYIFEILIIICINAIVYFLILYLLKDNIINKSLKEILHKLKKSKY